METVAIEWVSLVAIEPRDVVQFVQNLRGIPKNAVCEVGSIFSRSYHSRSRNQNERQIQSEVQLSCEPSVAAFLCNKFSKQTQHVTGGEVIRVRCKRVFPVSGKTPAEHGDISMHHGSNSNATPSDDPSDEVLRAPDAAYSALPIEKVIALVDLLGDQVVDVQEAYEFFSDPDACGPQRMTMLGFSKALVKLCEKTTPHTDTVKIRLSSRKPVHKKSTLLREGGLKFTVENLRHLVSRLIASNNVGVRQLPSATNMPFLSYTDFLACYVAFLAKIQS